MTRKRLVARNRPRNQTPPRNATPLRCCTGFTLIELLVVVSIISLLISILLPSLKSAREQARLVKCMAHVRGMGQAGFTFAQEHGGRFQIVCEGGETLNRVDESRTKFAYDEQGELLSWPVAMAQAAGLTGFDHNYNWGVRADDWVTADQRRKFMSEEFKLPICPSDTAQISTPYYPDKGKSGAGLKPLPEGLELPDGFRYWGYLSYGINEDVVGADDSNGGFKPACWKNGYFGQIHGQGKAGNRLAGNLDRIFDPGTCLLMVDAGPNSRQEAASGVYDNQNDQGYANLIISAKVLNGPYLGDHRSKYYSRIPDKRHPGGKLNVLFADFHAETVRPVEFWWVSTIHREIPRKYAPRVRVSPYRPWKES